MTLEWDVPACADFPEEVINKICDRMRTEGYNEDVAVSDIMDEVMGWDDEIYYLWSSDQTKEVLKEIQRRLVGVQISMFEEE